MDEARTSVTVGHMSAAGTEPEALTLPIATRLNDVAGDSVDGLLVVFAAPWVTAYRILAPVIGEVIDSGVAVATVNVDVHATTAIAHNVRSLPTFVWVVGGAEQRRRVGAVGVDELVALCAAPTRSTARVGRRRRR